MAPAGVARGRLPGWVLAVAAVLAFAAVSTWLVRSTWDDVQSSRLDVGNLTDFRDAVYYPVVALDEGVNPYDPSAFYANFPVGQEFPLYSPVHLVVHYPLVALSFPQARAVYFGLNLALLLILAWAGLQLAGYRMTVAKVFGVGTLLALSSPGEFDLRTGEPTLLVVLGIYLALAAARRHPGWGALGLVLALTKPTFGIPLVVLMLCRRETRAAIGGTIAATVMSLVVAVPLVSAAGGISKFVDALREDLDVTSRSLQSRLGSPLRVDPANTLARLSGLRPSETVATVFGLVLLGVGAWLVLRLHRHDPRTDRSELAITLACVTLLVSVFHVGYDLLLLTWPILLLWRRRPDDAGTWPRYARPTVLALLLYVMVDPTRWPWVNDPIRDSLFGRLAGPTTIGLALLAAFALCGWAVLRTTMATLPLVRPRRGPDAVRPAGARRTGAAGGTPPPHP